MPEAAPRLDDDAGVPPPRATWALPAAPGSVASIRSGVRRFAIAHGAPDVVVQDVVLAVTEAVTNAVLHGYVDREPGTVRAEASAGRDEIVVVVADDGRGMQPRADSPGIGLGLPLIGQLAAALDLREPQGGGTELHMTFAAPGVSAPAVPPGADTGAALLDAVGRTAAGAWPGEGVERLVDLLVPAVANACAVDVIDDTGRPKRFAGRVDGPNADADSARLARLEPRADAPGSATRAAVEERGTRISELTPELIAAVTTNAQDAEWMAATGVRWWVVVPLVDEPGRMLGLMHFGMRPECGRPGRERTDLLEAIAARAGGALASARLVAEVRRARRRFERILDVLGEAVTVRDRTGQLVYANDAAARLLGAPSREALLGAGLAGVTDRLELAREDGTPIGLDDLPASRLLEGLPAPPLLMRAVDRESGAERWLLVKVTPLDDEGEPLVVGILEDVTETRHV